MEGYGSKNPVLCVIAEAPAGTEDVWCKICERPSMATCEQKHPDQIGMPLIGPAGQLLRQVLKDVGINPADVFMTNSVRCGAKLSGNPTALESKKCKSYLLDELSKLDWSKCKGVMLLGQVAIRSLLNNGRLTVRETRHRVLDTFGPDQIPTVEALEGATIDDLGSDNGEIASQDESRVLEPYYNKLIQAPLRSTFHPSAALPHHDPSLYQEIVQDFKDLIGKQRDVVKPVTMVTTIDELNQLFGESDVISLDAEWNTNGNIRMFGISNGVINAVCLDPNVVMEWFTV